MASITVVGSNFTGVTQCFFGAIGVTISLNAAGTSFTCIPPGQTGTVTIGITGSNGTVSRASGYTYVGSPTITALGTTSGSTGGGTFVRITGTNFYDRIGITFPGFYCGVSFGTVGVTADIYGITHCYVITPVSSVAGAVSIKLKTPTGVAIGLTFTYINYCSRLDPFPFNFPFDICIAGVTSSCLNDVGPAGRSGCNCTACCDAVCDSDGGCCSDGGVGNWKTNGCATKVLEEIATKTGAIYQACKHLVNGSCCVKLNISGASFSFCLDPQGSSAECTDLVNHLSAGNTLTFPWKYPYTYNFVQGGNCSSCQSFCLFGGGGCLIDLESEGITCSNDCGPCCSRYGYCGGGCICDIGETICPSPTEWDPIRCGCFGGVGEV